MVRRAALSIFLKKLSKHIAFLVCLMILGKVSHRLEIGQLTILGWTAAASLLQMIGLAVQPRPSPAERV